MSVRIAYVTINVFQYCSGTVVNVSGVAAALYPHEIPYIRI